MGAPRLYLVDGSALAYRSHFAFVKNPLRNAAGLNTSAAFGFTRELLRLVDEERPDLLAVVFDVSKRTFRHERYPDYKATRAQMPDDLVASLPYLDRIVDALGIARLGVEGFEADDVIATVARRGREAGYAVRIVSPDKDLCQLVDEQVWVINPWRRGGPGLDVLDPQRVEEKFGVPASRLRDYLALRGDSSDNVPGVPGVGPKRAVELLTQFGSLEQVLAGAAGYGRKAVREKLLAHADQARLSLELVTLDDAVPVEEDLAALAPGAPDRGELFALFSELEFREFTGRFSRDIRSDPHVHHRVTSDAELDALVARLEACAAFVFDLETTSLDPRQAEIVGMAFSWQEGEAWYVPPEESVGAGAFELFAVRLDFSRRLERLRPVLEDPARPKGGQNVKYDVQVLARHGVTVRGVAFDTLLESYVLDPSLTSHGLDALALRHLGYTKIATGDVMGRGKKRRSMAETPDDEIFPYASEDADITFRLHRRFSAELAREPRLERLYREVELPLQEVLRRMEETGVRVDAAVLGELEVELRARLGELEAEAHRLAGEPFNLASTKQVGELLFDRLRLHEAAGVRVKRTAGGAASTDREVLEALAPSAPLAATILEHRGLEKLLGTYVEALPRLVAPSTGRVHTSFNQAVTATGRLSSSEPNLQNIPIRTPEGRRIRAAFVAEPGWELVGADYSQVELRVLAHLSGDEALCAAFREGVDVHRATAARVFDVPLDAVDAELRGRAKAINFGIVYGMGAQRLARDTGLSLDEAREFIAGYFRAHPGVKDYLDRQVAQARAEGYVETVLGRRRPLRDIRSPRRASRANAERMALNTPIQGSAADIIKLAMVRIDERLRAEGLRARLLLQVHDELLLEAPGDEAVGVVELVRDAMQGALALAVPLVVEAGRGRTWLDVH